MGSRSRSKSESKERLKKEKKDKKEKKERRDKDRDRDDKKKRKKEKHRRSRSRSHRRDKDRKKRRERSWERRSRSRSNYRFDTPPKEQSQFGGLQTLPLDTGSLQQAQAQQQLQAAQALDPAMSQVQTQQMMQKLKIVQAQQELATSKADRKIYVGNIPQDMTAPVLTQLMNQALKQMNVNQDPPGESIVGSWISPDQHYSFIEFRTPEEATRGLNVLSQAEIKLKGQQVKFGRPKQYIQQTSAIEATQQSIGPEIQSLQVQQPVKSEASKQITLINKINPIGSSFIFDSNQCTKYNLIQIQIPTRVLVLLNLFSDQDLYIDEEFDDIYNDVKEECEKHGSVVKLLFPRPTHNEEVDYSKGHGNVYCKYSTVDEARDARRELQGRLYGRRTIECIYLDEDKFNKDEYKITL